MNNRDIETLNNVTLRIMNNNNPSSEDASIIESCIVILQEVVSDYIERSD